MPNFSIFYFLLFFQKSETAGVSSRSRPQSGQFAERDRGVRLEGSEREEQRGAMEALTGMFERWGIDETTTRSRARRGKKQARNDSDFCVCVVCFKAFNEKRELRKHISKKHKADKEALKEDFREAKQALEANQDGGAERNNYKLALMKLIALEKLFKAQ